MASIFSKIINGEIPCYKIKEDVDFIAFLDIMPLQKGHVLIVPKIEINNLFDAETSILSKWLVFAQPIAKAIEKSFDCNRCGICVIGLEVPHAHMHLVPIKTANDINFTNPKLSLSSVELELIQQKIITSMQ